MSTSLATSFRCPIHHSPSTIAYAFNYNPYISIKIDGFFTEVQQNDYEKYYPVFPSNWTKIIGELYQEKGKQSLLFVFFIEANDKKFNNINEMYQEIETYFNSNINSGIKFKNDETNIKNDMLHNISLAVEWREKNSSLLLDDMLWFPKKYWKLNTTNWNDYIEQLNDIYNFVNNKSLNSLIKNDGIVISPFVPTIKKNFIKIKPINEMTIDLFCHRGKFYSKNRTDYTNIMRNYNPHNYKTGSVYRLAPDSNGYYYPICEREITKKPNPDTIIEDIIYKQKHYFNLLQLKNLYNDPWYKGLNKNSLNEVLPLFEFTQKVYLSIIDKMKNGLILDIGCGSMGRYYNLLKESKDLNLYVGLDIDLAKLHEAQTKIMFDLRFKYMLLDISYRWNRQQDKFGSIWNTYFHDVVKLNQKFDNIISIFSSQYANINKQTWNNYVNEINFRSKIGTKLFFMWIDYTKIKEEKQITKYYEYDKNMDVIKIMLPHRETHIEPKLGNEIIDSFVNKGWNIDNDMNNIIIPQINNEFSISSYIELINWISLIKS